MSDETNDEGPRSFARFIEQVADGEAQITASAELHELGKALKREASAQNAKVKGKLTLSLSFEADPMGAITVGYDVDMKAPKPKRGGSIFWTTKDGNLSAEHPRQARLPLHEVSEEAGTVVEFEVSQEMKEI